MAKRTHRVFTFKKAAHLSSVLTLCVILSGCAYLPQSVTERDVSSALSMPEEFQAQELPGSQIIDGLLSVFDDEKLNALVEQSLRHNLNIQLAAKQLEEAGFNANAQWGNALPQVNGNLSTSRSQGAQGKAEGTYSPSLDVSWEIDIWGKLRNQRESLDATALANAENYQAINDSIAGQVMQSWFDVVTAKSLIDLEQSRLSNLQKSAQNSRWQYQSGLANLDDLSAIQRDIAQTKATLAANTDNHNTAVRSLKILMGQYPDSHIALDYTLPALVSSPTSGVPAHLLTNRPDLRSAWQNVVAADKSVTVAHKAMFPTLVLTGSLGTQSNVFSDLMSGATIWSLANNITVPIFNDKQLENNMHAAQSRAEQAWLIYLQTALIAFQEVEQTLNRETLLADQERQQQDAVLHAEETRRVFEDRYKNGLISILEYLNAQNTVFNMKSQLIQIRNERLKNRIALALALGKGV